jgi:hypothetical protein
MIASVADTGRRNVGVSVEGPGSPREAETHGKPRASHPCPYYLPFHSKSATVFARLLHHLIVSKLLQDSLNISVFAQKITFAVVKIGF